MEIINNAKLQKYCLRYLKIKDYELVAKKSNVSVSSIYNYVKQNKISKKNADKIKHNLINALYCRLIEKNDETRDLLLEIVPSHKIINQNND